MMYNSRGSRRQNKRPRRDLDLANQYKFTIANVMRCGVPHCGRIIYVTPGQRGLPNGCTYCVECDQVLCEHHYCLPYLYDANGDSGHVRF